MSRSFVTGRDVGCSQGKEMRLKHQGIQPTLRSAEKCCKATGTGRTDRHISVCLKAIVCFHGNPVFCGHVLHQMCRGFRERVAVERKREGSNDWGTKKKKKKPKSP